MLLFFEASVIYIQSYKRPLIDDWYIPYLIRLLHHKKNTKMEKLKISKRRNNTKYNVDTPFSELLYSSIVR